MVKRAKGCPRVSVYLRQDEKRYIIDEGKPERESGLLIYRTSAHCGTQRDTTYKSTYYLRLPFIEQFQATD
jgi:hypothetical protein